MPPSKKIETSTLLPVGAAWAIPRSKAESGIFEAPYTASARPALREMNLRRDSPVPAGSGIPGSIAGSPRPASAAPARSIWARVKSRQHSWLIASLALSLQDDVGADADQLQQRVLAQRPVGALLPAGGDLGFAAAGEIEQLGAVFGAQFRAGPGGERPRQRFFGGLGLRVGASPRRRPRPRRGRS